MNNIQKQLTDMVFDINPAEISSHIENDSLRQWCQTWGSKMLEIISSIPFAKDGNYEKGYQDGLNADKWIFMEDKEPETNGSYLTLHENGGMNVGTWTNWGWMFGHYVKDVIAWQELPLKPNKNL